MLIIHIVFFALILFFFDFNSIFTDIPVNWQVGFQNPATPVMEGIIWLHNYILLFLIVVIVVVLWFLCRSLYLFNEYINKEAMEFNHDPVIEAIWTIAPAFVLIAIAIPSFSLLYSMDEVIKPTLTVKIIGHQWYWSYELDSIFRQDIFFDYVKRRINPVIDIFDLQRWEWANTLNFFKVRALRWEKFLNHLFVHRVVLKAMWTSNSRSISAGHLSFLVAASKMIWKNETYHSLMSISPANRIGVIEHPIKLRTTFYSLLSSIAFSDSILSAVKWLSSSVRFDSYMLPEMDLPLGGLRLLEVDNWLVLPVKVHIRLLITSTDVIHSWAIPSFGIKVDAIPGRLNQTPLYIKREGFFYGQCSELCGVNHGFMPIVVQSVDYNTFIHWIRINSNPSRLDVLLNSNWKVVVEDVETEGTQRLAEKYL